MFKRVILFILTNLAVVFVLSIVLHLLGADRFLTANGIDYRSLLIFSGVFGMGGSFISLVLSKWMALRATGARVIEQPRNEHEAWLFDTVARHAERAGIGMPSIAVYDAPEMNAFATGANRNAALVAVSTGLLSRMSRPEVDAVLGHEISHVANGDMVTLTLLQGVVNTFVIFISRVVGYTVDRAVFRTERGRGPGMWITIMVTEMLLGILATIIVAWFSRRREFRADAGGAALAGRDNMISALARLGGERVGTVLPESMRAFGVRDGASMWRLFSTHPPIEERIAALREGQSSFTAG